MISFLPQLFLEFVERIRLRADRLSTAFLDDAEDTRLLVNFVLANVNVLLDAVNRSTFEIIRRVEDPARVSHKVDWNRLEYGCSHQLVCVKFPRWLVVNLVRSKVMMS